MKNQLRVLVCGGRDYKDWKTLSHVLSSVDNSYESADAIGPISCIISGGARGADTMAAQWAKENNNGEFSFYTYDEFMTDPKNVLLDIYKFCEWDFFEHDFKNIKCKYPEDDSVHGSLFTGMHEVRPVLGYRQIAA